MEKDKERESALPALTITVQDSAEKGRDNMPRGGGGKVQERNVYAVNVLKRVKAKLEGRVDRFGNPAAAGEPVPPKLSVAQQVHFLPSVYFSRFNSAQNVDKGELCN